jgi:adenylosuccinate synthase
VLVGQSVSLSGITGIALTKLDVLTGLEKVKICTGYSVGYDEIPTCAIEPETLAACETYMKAPGWWKISPGSKYG